MKLLSEVGFVVLPTECRAVTSSPIHLKECVERKKKKLNASEHQNKEYIAL